MRQIHVSNTMAVRPEPVSCYWSLGIFLQNVKETFSNPFLLGAVIVVAVVVAVFVVFCYCLTKQGRQ